MHSPFLLQGLVFGPIVFLILCILVPALHADQKLLIFDFNRDCAADTLCGDIKGDTVVPTHIRWGDHAPCPPPGDPFNNALRHAHTQIKLPSWLCMQVASLSGNLNSAQDSTDDLTFLIKGKTADGQGGFVDESRGLIIFGRHGLDTLDTLNLCLVTSASLSTPFAAMTLGSSNLTSPTELWPGINSVRVSAVSIPSARQGQPEDEAAAPPGSVRAWISPTPSRDQALLTVEGLPAGRHRLEIIDALGRSIQTFSLDGSATLEHQLDLSSLVMGQYSVLLDTGHSELLSVPLIIVR